MNVLKIFTTDKLGAPCLRVIDLVATLRASLLNQLVMSGVEGSTLSAGSLHATAKETYIGLSVSYCVVSSERQRPDTHIAGAAICRA